MSGKRVHLSDLLRSFLLLTGEYAARAGEWLAVLPNDQLVRLTDHAVTEHPDGTITVHGDIVRHGAYTLTRGIWAEVG